MNTQIKLDGPRDLARDHQIVSQQDWLVARKALLAKEKEATLLLDRLASERQQLPWVKLTKEYTFVALDGTQVSLADLFAGRSQLAVYHFMFGPEWQEGCPSCSYVSDHLNAALPHLQSRDVTLVAISRAPITKIAAFRSRLGWKFNWVSAKDSDFNMGFHVSFTSEQVASGRVEYNYCEQDFPSEEGPGMSLFYKDEGGAIYHTYSTFSRGLDQLMTAYRVLDMSPRGRHEEGLEHPMAWVRYHDRYEAGAGAFADADKPYWPDASQQSSGGGCCHSKVEVPA